ncbi:MAG: precorrin-6A synthase (deacetylating) [Aestuariivita sp.]|nr:precorrin-6A synthase (deacetylating) [Aestuariivita sp.]MCY4202668.1 precorrin-6A synthase (deacetylating) [Aestuariivita sp.]MCY4287312.1 precorrin-6A synthase (deacetylating) [Aestuariivita sp.]MCY4346545.1 precorrin-6A synthase (deacetylating) [Aestuariivita sp.]
MNIRDLWLIGIGTGSSQHVTRAGEAAIRSASVILLPRKSHATADLFDLRCKLLDDVGYKGTIQTFDYPNRDPSLPYLERVAEWHKAIAKRWQGALSGIATAGPVGLLIWGDPSLYDSTIRIANELTPSPRVRVIPGITAIQALTSAFSIPLNSIAGSIKVTTGRRLRQEGWPSDIETVVLMLDGETSFMQLTEPNLEIWWGAYLGTPDQILIHGKLPAIGEHIRRRRAEARERKGWIMDTYILRKSFIS